MIFKSNKKFFLHSFHSSLPGFISIILSLLSIPIYLQYAGTVEYGNYIFLHFLSFVAVILNFGLGKVSAITVTQSKDGDNKSLLLLKKTFVNSFIVFLILALILISNEFFLFTSRNFLFLATLSIVLTIVFVTIEGIFQGRKLFFALMLINLFFYGVSLSVPPLLLMTQYASYITIFFLSVVIKASVVIISIFYLFKKKPLNFFFQKQNLLNFHYTQKWFSIATVLNIVFDFTDRYLIKIFIGPAALALYSIPQQLTGKLSIISKGIAAVLLPAIAYGGKNKIMTKEFIISLNIFIFIIPILIFFLFNFFDLFFNFWLGKNYSIQIIPLAKIFSIITWVSCISHLITSYYEGSGIIKKSATIELAFYPFFFSFLYMAVLNANLFIIAFVILLKEIFLYVLKSISLSKKINPIKYSYLIITLSCFYLFYTIDLNILKLLNNE